jgi:hypothetical protein
MRRRLFLALIVVAVLLLALGGWAADAAPIRRARTP